MCKRPILIITICYILGIIGGLYLNKNIVFLFNVLIVLGLIYNKLHKKININYKVVIISLLIICISFEVALYKKNKYSNLYKNINNIQFVGVIVSDCDESDYYNKYIIKIKKINNSSKYFNTKVILKIKKNNNYNLKYGDLIIGDGVYNKPDISRNYGGFNYKNYLNMNGIYGVCELNEGNLKILKENSISMFNREIHNIQQYTKNNLRKGLKQENANIAIAFLLGDTSFITDIERNMYSRANLSHILAISGMHVTYFIVICNFILKKASKRSRLILNILLLFIFMVFTGNSISVVRAVIMLSIYLLSKLVYRKSDTINNISISCLIIIIINPYNIYNLGFQLSFLGTIGIVLFNKKINYLTETITDKIYNKTTCSNFLIKCIKKIISIIIISLSANILIIPILAYNFNEITFTFLISSVLITPFLCITFFVGYINILTSFFSINLILKFSVLLELLLNIINYIANISSKINFLRFQVVTPNIKCIILYYIVVIYIFKFFNKKHIKIIKKALIPIILIIAIISYFNNFNRKLSIYFIDVGQGDSTLIVTKNNKKILIDGGGSEGSTYNVGEKVLIPYLLDRHITQIDYLIISHFDEDHCGGLYSVIQNLNVKNIIIGKQFKTSDNYIKFIKLIKEKNIKLNIVEKGDKLHLDKNVIINILWPNSSNIIDENVLNNNSLVFKLEYKNFSMLFTGDIEEIGEKEIVKEYSANLNLLKSTVLKVAHHGSKTSTNIEFLNSVKPKFALIGVGKNNKFGHPNNTVLERLRLVNCKIFRTDECGEISIKVDNKGNINRIDKLIVNME